MMMMIMMSMMMMEMGNFLDNISYIYLCLNEDFKGSKTAYKLCYTHFTGCLTPLEAIHYPNYLGGKFYFHPDRVFPTSSIHFLSSLSLCCGDHGSAVTACARG